VEHLVTATRLDPNNETAHYHLAKAYRVLGRSAEANQEMSEFKKLHTAHAAEHLFPILRFWQHHSDSLIDMP